MTPPTLDPRVAGDRAQPRAPRRRGLRRLLALATVLAGSLTLATTATAAPPLQLCTPGQVRATERHWYFGTRGHIDFGTSGTATTATVGSKSAVEGSTVVTDVDGTLLFWSNGQQVYDRNSDLMPNGAGLLGNDSATQTVAAFPAIGHPGRYFVVTTSAEASVNHGSGPGKGDLTYSVVDMTANGGLGEVTATKNVALGTAGTASEAITAVPNDDGTGFWVITNTQGGPEVLAYEFDENGPVTGTAVVSTMPSNNYNGFGSLTVSSDLTKIALMSGNVSAGTQPAKLRLLTLDASTGVLTQTAEWNTATTGSNGYYADFSPSGRYLYATRIFNGARLLRYDIGDPSDAVAIKASEEDLGAIGNGGAVRRAPDGRMYVANRGAATLTTVDAPDDAADPQVQPNGYTLPAGAANGWGLAQTVTGCAKPLAPPTATVSGPTDGTTVPTGAPLTAGFSCHGEAAPVTCGAKVRRPDGSELPVTDGAPLPTDQPGVYTITVTAIDAEGRTITATRTYVVTAPPLLPPVDPPVQPAPGRLVVSKTLSRKTVRPGQSVRTTIRVRNGGGTTLHDVRVCERVPAGLRFVSATPKATLSSGSRCWTIKTLRPGQTATRTYSARALNRPGRLRVRTTTRATGAATRATNATLTIRRAPARAGGVTG
ncbi:hypothetical protein [Patulibacter defluvii]|uniref:hypothetical protein n=1 Tax=Patulibacter defluvii TaxID=3095358 RepID=UPI002A75C2DF|nr:hypothetical protein [Patulibacter sp. DM4]